jgi:hypothetical protein
MNQRSFEEQIKHYVPDFMLRQFRHIIISIPGTDRLQFLSLLRKEGDMNTALNRLSAINPLASWKDLMHQRMQDSMCEITD